MNDPFETVTCSCGEPMQARDEKCSLCRSFEGMFIPPKGKPLDTYHTHELLDRVHSINVMFQELVRTHPAAKLMNETVLEDVETALQKLYQEAALIRLAGEP